MIGVKFERHMAARFADRLRNGKAVVAKSPIELLHLAGAAFALADEMSSGGEFGLSTAALPAFPPDHEEVPRSLAVLLAVQFCGNMAKAIAAGAYNAEFPPAFDAVVYMRNGQPAYALLADHESN